MPPLVAKVDDDEDDEGEDDSGEGGDDVPAIEGEDGVRLGLGVKLIPARRSREAEGLGDILGGLADIEGMTLNMRDSGAHRAPEDPEVLLEVRPMIILDPTSTAMVGDNDDETVLEDAGLLDGIDELPNAHVSNRDCIEVALGEEAGGVASCIGVVEDREEEVGFVLLDVFAGGFRDNLVIINHFINTNIIFDEMLWDDTPFGEESNLGIGLLLPQESKDGRERRIGRPDLTLSLFVGMDSMDSRANLVDDGTPTRSTDGWEGGSPFHGKCSLTHNPVDVWGRCEIHRSSNAIDSEDEDVFGLAAGEKHSFVENDPVHRGFLFLSRIYQCSSKTPLSIPWTSQFCQIQKIFPQFR